MGHVVHYRTATGDPRLEDVASMDAAVELIERLRNDEGVEDVRLFREVPLKVRTYYKVVVDDEVEAPVAEEPVAPKPRADHSAGEPPPGAMNLSPPPAAVPAGLAPVADEPEDEPRRASLFNRG